VTDSWDVDPLEFLVRWESQGQPGLPAPLTFRSATESRTAFLGDKARVRARLRDEPRPDLNAAMAVLARPDVRVAVQARSGLDPADRRRCLRLYAARRGERACVVRQRIGETVDHSAGFTLTTGPAPALGELVANALPHAARGSRPATPLPGADRDSGHDYGVGRRAWRDSFDEPPPRAALRLLSTPPVTVGLIDIAQGRSRFGPRGLSGHRMTWRDLLDDGRYLITEDEPPLAVPADRAAVVAMINARIAEIVHRLRDESA
jgi:hypothetical protein